MFVHQLPGFWVRHSPCLGWILCYQIRPYVKTPSGASCIRILLCQQDSLLEFLDFRNFLGLDHFSGVPKKFGLCLSQVSQVVLKRGLCGLPLSPSPPCAAMRVHGCKARWSKALIARASTSFRNRGIRDLQISVCYDYRDRPLAQRKVLP